MHLNDLHSSSRDRHFAEYFVFSFFCCARYVGSIEDGRSAGRSPRWRLRRDIRPSMNFISRSCRAARLALGLTAGYDRAQQPLRSLLWLWFRFRSGTLRRSGERCIRYTKTSPHLSPQFAASTRLRGARRVGAIPCISSLRKLDEKQRSYDLRGENPSLSKPIRRNAKGPLRSTERPFI